MVPGVVYERIDDLGLHLSVGGERTVIECDTVVLCTGQEPLREMHDELVAASQEVHLIGGADVAAELDAKRAHQSRAPSSGPAVTTDPVLAATLTRWHHCVATRDMSTLRELLHPDAVFAPRSRTSPIPGPTRCSSSCRPSSRSSEDFTTTGRSRPRDARSVVLEFSAGGRARAQGDRHDPHRRRAGSSTSR